MGKTKEWWTAKLFAVGCSLAYHISPDRSRWDGYRVRVSAQLDRDPGRIVYIELSVTQAKHLVKSLETGIHNAETYNRRAETQPDPLDKSEE